MQTSEPEEGLVRRKPDVLAVLRRSGVPEETVRALDEALDDPVNIERESGLFLRHGITLESLVDAMGGSL